MPMKTIAITICPDCRMHLHIFERDFRSGTTAIIGCENCGCRLQVSKPYKFTLDTGVVPTIFGHYVRSKFEGALHEYAEHWELV